MKRAARPVIEAEQEIGYGIARVVFPASLAPYTTCTRRSGFKSNSLSLNTPYALRPSERIFIASRQPREQFGLRFFQNRVEHLRIGEARAERARHRRGNLRCHNRAFCSGQRGALSASLSRTRAMRSINVPAKPFVQRPRAIGSGALVAIRTLSTA